MITMQMVKMLLGISRTQSGLWISTIPFLTNYMLMLPLPFQELAHLFLKWIQGQDAIPFMQDGDIDYYNVKLPSYLDANIGMEYRYNSRTSVWVKVQ